MVTYTVRDDTDQPLEYFTDLATAVTAVDVSHVKRICSAPAPRRAADSTGWSPPTWTPAT